MITAHLTGKIGADAQLRGSDKKFISFSVAVFDPFKKEDAPTEWVDCTTNIKQESPEDNSLLKRLKKGASVHIIGKPYARIWEKENKEAVARLSMYCDEIEVLSIPKPE